MSWILDGEVLAVLVAITMISAVLATVQMFSAGRVVEPFSELGLLGPDGKIGGYPEEAVAGSPFTLNVYVGNHEGKTVYYKVLIKLGDGSSIINETTPLLAEPIMEIRAVLSHNSSQIIPVNITLYKPATSLKLVFEMWIFNETSGAFSYHGRWNQLWINVTGPPLAAPASASYGGVSPELESKLVEAYLSIRRAEGAGGNVSEMVGMLNRALWFARGGDEAGAESLIGQVLAMEPEVSRLGVEASRMRLFTGLTALAVTSTIGVGCFIHFRRRVWVYWARLHRGWRVIWTGDGFKLSNLERTVRDRVKSNREIRVEELLSKPASGYGVYEVAKALYRLARSGALRLVDPSPPRSFLDYFLSIYNMGFVVAAFLVVACLLSVYGSNLTPALAVLRVILGSIFTLFLPGYSLIEALYPRGDELSPLERLALSIGLSLALVPLVGLLLNYTPWGIRLNPIMAVLSTLTLALLFISAYRKFGVLRLKAVASG